jgi:hypothetical protein
MMIESVSSVYTLLFDDAYHFVESIGITPRHVNASASVIAHAALSVGAVNVAEKSHNSIATAAVVVLSEMRMLFTTPVPPDVRTAFAKDCGDVLVPM